MTPSAMTSSVSVSVPVPVALLVFFFFFCACVIDLGESDACVPGDGSDYDNVTTLDIDDMRDALADLFDRRSADDATVQTDSLIGTAVRLIFHDCAGPTEGNVALDSPSICDGCIQRDNGDHAGLEEFGVWDLEGVYNDTDFCFNERMSRADFWATAANLAIEAALFNDGNEEMARLLPYYFGRRACTDSPWRVSTEAPMRAFPSAIGGNDHVQTWFATRFGFTAQEITALLGVHTIGVVHEAGAGFVIDGGTRVISPWTSSRYAFDNAYYILLRQAIWQNVFNDESKWVWERIGGANLIMLNADISLFLNVDVDATFISSGTGHVGCTFTGAGTDCTRSVNSTLEFVNLYASDKTAWLQAFAAVYAKMVTAGYSASELYEVDGDIVTQYYTTEVDAAVEYHISLSMLLSAIIVCVVSFVY